MIEIDKILVNAARESINKRFQLDDGSFKEGHNGPWFDIDTRVRTTAHWAIVLSYAYYKTQEIIFFDSASKAYEYLKSPSLRPYNKNFECRLGEKNHSNGLIGPAWIIESMLYGFKFLGDSSLLKISKEIILLQKYDWKHHLFRVCEIDGKDIGIEYTINQQIWLATQILEYMKLTNDFEYQKVIDDFFLNLEDQIAFITPGLISHNSIKKEEIPVFKNIKRYIKYNVLRKKNKLTEKELWLRSRGYQSFILYALARAYELDSNLPVFISEKFTNNLKIINEYMLSNYLGKKSIDKWSWQYNCTGIEMAYFNKVFNLYLQIDDNSESWLQEQYTRHMSNEGLMNQNTVDSKILESRIYELILLID